MVTTLFEGGVVVTGAGSPRAGWVLIEDSVIVGTGDLSDAPRADRRIDLAGAALVPAFCDAHVHLPATGLYEGGLDLRGVTRANAIVAALSRRAEEAEGPLFAGNFEDPPDGPLDARSLDRAVGDRPAMLARADMHSCVVSSALLASLDVGNVAGVDRDGAGRPTGYLREQAAARAWAWFERTQPEREQREAVRRAARLAYSKGVASVHEMYVAEWRGWSALDPITEALAELALNAVVYVATEDVARVRERGLTRIGGDLFLDGSFGSHTAWLKEPYRSPPPPGSPATGISYRSTREVLDVFREAQGAGLQVGVHAIGDAAIEQAISCWEAVARETGRPAVRALRHRIEHFECASDDHLRRASRLGLAASVQPAFDRFWGGAEGMYAARIGPERALEMNRFRSMLDAGLLLGAGSDSTVTPLDPLLGMAALREHHVPEQSLGAGEALQAHTVGAHALAGEEGERGTIEPGKRADLAMLDRDPLTLSPEELSATEVVGTWVGGIRVWPEQDADAA